jgi:N,N-dimethylformamidase
MVSSEEDFYRVDIVRLIHGDANPDGPGFRATKIGTTVDGEYPGREQKLRTGSYAIIPDAPPLRLAGSFSIQLWLYPTAPGGAEQEILSKVAPDGSGYSLSIDGGYVALGMGGGGAKALRGGMALRERSWHFVCVTYDRARELARLVVEPVERWPLDTPDLTEVAVGAAPMPNDVPLLLAARWTADREALIPTQHYNGKIESPRIFARALDDREIDLLRRGDLPDEIEDLIAAWDFSRDMDGRRVTDTGPHGLHGRTVNMPARMMTGHAWDRTSVDPAVVPHQYGGIHFHDDDLDNAVWDVDFELTVSEDMPSGIYAAHLQTDGHEDFVPFFVRPRRGRPTARIALVLPTFSYLAYGNEHMLTNPVNREIFEHFGTTPEYPSQPQDVYVVENRLNSLYDVHTDGSGVCYASRLRPILNMRPKYDFMLLSRGNGAPHQLNADLHLVDWLHAQGFEFDTLTDEDLHAEGAELLEPYRAVLSGTHHEYWSRAMLDGLESYLHGGGRFLYLSGNGMYWVTGVDPEEGHTIEVRRFGVTRSWEAAPGEWHLSTTGELGGPWRFHGRAPQRILGVGYAAEGFDRGRPYTRREGSFDPRVSFIFEGVGDDEQIGDFPVLVNEWGAAGYEIDRLDHALGTPHHALLLATATGFSDGYQHAIEENFASDSLQGGSMNPYVRADMCFFEYPNDGAVFSTGSISWCSALSHNAYDNNVSRITRNVLSAFAQEGRLPSAGVAADDRPNAESP